MIHFCWRRYVRSKLIRYLWYVVSCFQIQKTSSWVAAAFVVTVLHDIVPLFWYRFLKAGNIRRTDIYGISYFRLSLTDLVQDVALSDIVGVIQVMSFTICLFRCFRNADTRLPLWSHIYIKHVSLKKELACNYFLCGLVFLYARLSCMQILFLSPNTRIFLFRVYFLETCVFWHLLNKKFIILTAILHC